MCISLCFLVESGKSVKRVGGKSVGKSGKSAKRVGGKSGKSAKGLEVNLSGKSGKSGKSDKRVGSKFEVNLVNLVNL